MSCSSVILRLHRLQIFPGNPMKILSISLDLELLQLRRAALEAAGHEVVIVDSEKEALQTVQAPESFGAVLLCHRFPDAIARQTVRLVRQSHPDTRVIYISHLYGEWPEVEADRYIVGADGPEALVRVLQEVHA
jgi:DNA-binding response OmpR family regulator